MFDTQVRLDFYSMLNKDTDVRNKTAWTALTCD